MELVSARRHLQSAADMGKRPKRAMRPQRHPAHAHAKAVPLTSKVIRTRFAARSGSQRMCRARARSIRLDRQASLDGLDHHAEKERARPTGSGCSEVRRAACSPARSAAPTAMALISWLRLAVKERRGPPTPRRKKWARAESDPRAVHCFGCSFALSGSPRKM